MSERLSLDALRVGESARVEEIAAEPAMRRRLLDLGLIRGTRVTCIARSPWGGPAAYLVCGAVIALRGQEALGVAVSARQGVHEQCPSPTA